MKWYGKVWKNYFNFSGRARRTEYWMFVLFNAIISAIFCILIGILGASVFSSILSAVFSGGSLDDAFNTAIGAVIVAGILGLYGLAALIPSLAVVWRRLHDQNKRGWWIFINLIPLIGEIWFLVLLCTAGTKGENRFGPDPKA